MHYCSEVWGWSGSFFYVFEICLLDGWDNKSIHRNVIPIFWNFTIFYFEST